VQYSVTEHFRSSESGHFFQSLPGIFFFYDISPVKVGIFLFTANRLFKSVILESHDYWGGLGVIDERLCFFFHFHMSSFVSVRKKNYKCTLS
jgi:hypothetical protein